MVTLKNEIKQNTSTYLRVKVNAGARSNKIIGILDDNTYKINIQENPLKNRANKALVNFLADQLEIDARNVIIINGKASKLKLIKINYVKQ